MKSTARQSACTGVVLALLCLIGEIACSASRASAPEPAGLWTHDNLVAWETASYDSKKRDSEARAQMLDRLGIKRYAYLPSRDPFGEDREVTSQLDIDAEIDAMKRHGIEVVAWYFWVNVDDPATDPKVVAALDSFKRHHIHPQLWVAESFSYQPRTTEDWAKFLPGSIVYPKTSEEFDKLSEAEKQSVSKAYDGASAMVELLEIPKTQEAQEQRVLREADRIAAFVKLATPYGCRVNIYNHRNWFGYIENELAILAQLQTRGVSNVGMVYNFSHSRDRYHDDSKTFSLLWEKMKAHVVQVNVTGISQEGAHPLYPSQGTGELEMMRVIQESGWRGPIGLLGDKEGDAETTLQKTLMGVAWIAAELKQRGSGGPRPVLTVP
jgi:hypothetical protein